MENAGKYQEAIEAYTKAIELDPKYAVAYYGRGLIYVVLGDYRQAIRDYDKAIELDPKDADGLFYPWTCLRPTRGPPAGHQGF